jgi:hypothetical protein
MYIDRCIYKRVKTGKYLQGFYNFMNMQQEKKYCLYCEKLLKGRSDKRYCDDGCRTAFFNEQKKEEHGEIKIIDLTLKKNRRILKTMLGESKTKSVGEKQLLVKGFNFKYCTHVFKNPSGDEYHFCYDYGYRPTRDNKFMIVKQLPVVQEKL